MDLMKTFVATTKNRFNYSEIIYGCLETLVTVKRNMKHERKSFIKRGLISYVNNLEICA